MNRGRYQTRFAGLRAWLFILSSVGSLTFGAWRLGGSPAADFGLGAVSLGKAALPLLERRFSNTDDALLQQTEVMAYAETSQQPRRVVQVDLAQHPKISQFADINSSASGYGTTACGLVAAAAALGGKDWTQLVARLAEAAGNDYGRNTGIQPSKYTMALQKVLGVDRVSAKGNSTLGEIYQELAAGRVVIVDIKVNAISGIPSVRRPNYAHFARVLGMDLDRQEIYLENTLTGRPYWTVSLKGFVGVWLRPETTVSNIFAPWEAEEVTRWMVSLDRTIVI